MIILPKAKGVTPSLHRNPVVIIFKGPALAF